MDILITLALLAAFIGGLVYLVTRERPVETGGEGGTPIDGGPGDLPDEVVR